MYTPAVQVQSGSLPRSEPHPLSLENIKKINPEFKVASPETCSHIVGDTPQGVAKDWLRRTAIVWHTLNTGIEFGICLNCQHQFWPSDSDYSKWRLQKSFCFPSSAINNDPVVFEEPSIPIYVDTPIEGDFDILFGEENRNIIIIRGKGEKSESI